MSRDRILATARDWLGTPYQHQGSRRDVACDCLGLVRGIWREVIGPEPVELPAYSCDWAEVGGAETLLEAAQAWLDPVDPESANPGDVLLFRMSPNVPIKHCAILSSKDPAGAPVRMIHAYWGRAVVESWIGPWWRSRLAAAFAFPIPTEGDT